MIFIIYVYNMYNIYIICIIRKSIFKTISYISTLYESFVNSFLYSKLKVYLLC